MSTTTSTDPERVNKAVEYLNRYERDAVAELAQSYPTETRSLTVDVTDVFQYDPALAADLRDRPETIIPSFEAALQEADLPIQQDLSGAHVRFTLPESDHISASRVAERESGEYVAVEGMLSQVGERVSRISVAVFECQKCATHTEVPQHPERPDDGERTDPAKCVGCDRQGPFTVVPEKCESRPYRLLRIAQPPGQGAVGDQLYVDAYVEDDAVNVGCDVTPGEGEPLSNRAGDRVVAHGVLNAVPVTTGSLDYEYILDTRAISFQSSRKDVADVPTSEIENIARADDSSDRFRENMSPGTYDTDAWGLVKKVAEAFLFASPTINIDGEGQRGNIHWAIFGDPGLNKSQFMQSLRKLSVESAHVSASGKQVSEVGFTAAAIKDEFGGDNFTLKPGVLPRAGWHAFIDEIDKFDGDVTSLNDALEFPQQITVEKAGLRATLNTDCGVMVMGNPEGGRFTPDVDTWQQIREAVDPSLLSRFDAVIPLQDVPDKERDRDIAEHMLTHHREQAQRHKGILDESDADVSARDLPVEVLRSWIVEGRSYEPLLTDDAHRLLVDFFPDDRAKGPGQKPNYTFRKLDAGIRFTKAFARRDLSEEATVDHAEEAIGVLKPLIGLTYDGDGSFDPDVVLGGGGWDTDGSQGGDADAIVAAIRDEPKTAAQVAEETGIALSDVEHRLEQLAVEGDAMQPNGDDYRLI